MIADQHYAIASPAEIERTASQLASERERFLARGSVARPALRPVIADSWMRCCALQVNAACRRAPLAITQQTQLDQLLAANEPLLRAAVPVMARLSDFLAGSGYVTVLSDANGSLLDIVGDRAICRRLDRIDFIPGGDWSERAAGTNAIGTVIATGHAVQLMAAEHYCDGWQDLTCTAVPIRHPYTNEVLGTLDVTGNYRLIRPFLTSFLVAEALEIGQRFGALLGPPVPVAPTARQGPRSVAGSRHLTTPQPHVSVNEQRTRKAEQFAAAACAISASLDLTTTLEQVAEQTAHFFGLQCAAVCLWNEGGEVTTLHVWSHPGSAIAASHAAITAILRQEQRLARVYERGEPIIIDDLLPPVVCALALLPLTTARGVLGCVAAVHPAPFRWGADDLRLGLALAAQAATAIENARLFVALQQHTRHTEALNAIGQFLNTLIALDQRLDLVIKQIAASTGLEGGAILLCEGDSDELVLAAQSGMPLDSLPFHCTLLPALAQEVLHSGEPLLLCGLRGDDHRLPFSNLVLVPLVAGSAVLGVLLLGSNSPQALASEDTSLFTTIGQQLGLALKNVQLLRAASEMETLRETDRLKSEFLTAVSHDLRSPLTAIRASVENLLGCGGAQSIGEQEQLLLNIAGQAGRLGRLVDQLLDISRIEADALALDRDWTELPVLISDVIATFQELHPSALISPALAPDLPLLYIDPDSFTQVVWNLLENACKYGLPAAPIVVEACLMGNDLHVSVANAGAAIPAGEREKIFRPFYRLNGHKRSGPQGSGLGLAICRGIIAAHGGRITVADRPEGGSIFCITLPIPVSGPTAFELPEEEGKG